MPQQIQAPDGSIVEFPDNMSDDQISAAMQAEYGAPKKTNQFLGFVEGANQVGRNLEPLLSVLPYTAPTTMTRRQGYEAADQYAKAHAAAGERPGEVGKFLGGLAASAPTMMFGGPMTSGAIQGYATSGADDIQGKLADAGIGAVGGKMGGYLLGKAADLAAPVVSPAVRKLADAGVKLTPGQVRGGAAMVAEDKMMSKPVVGARIAADRAAGIGEWNRATIDRLALGPLGAKLPADVATGHEAIQFAQQALSDAYDTVVPKMATAIDRRFVAGLRKIAPDLKALPDGQMAQFWRIMDGVKFGQGGALAGQQLKNAQSELGRLSAVYNGSGAAGERELGRVLSKVRDELNDMMARQNPDLAGELQQINKGYRGLTVIENAAKNTDDGVFSTGQLKAAVRQGDKSVRKRATASGQAYAQDWSTASREVLPARTPNSFTADRLMTASLRQNVMAAPALVGYELGKRGAELALKARGPVATKIADTMRRLKGVGGGLSAAGLLQLIEQ